MFKNAKIAGKMIAAFLLTALFTGCVGIYGIVTFSAAQTLSEAIITGHGQSQANMGNIRSSFYGSSRWSMLRWRTKTPTAQRLRRRQLLQPTRK